MLEPKSVIDSEVPAVSPVDLQRFWSHQAQHFPDCGATFGYTREAISQVCETGADPIAVWARTVLISILVQNGLQENWREQDSLQEAVFQAVATFPLPNGLQNMNLSELIAKLSIGPHPPNRRASL